MASSALLAKVDAILEKSKKFRSEPSEPDWHQSVNKDGRDDLNQFECLQARNTIGANRESGIKGTNKTKIFAAMMDQIPSSQQQPPESKPIEPTSKSLTSVVSPNTLSADIASLASKYSSSIDITMSLSYKQKVELEELESRKNDIKLKAEILEKRLNAETQKLTEKEICLTKVKECY